MFKAFLEAIKQLSESIGIPGGLRELGVKEDDFELLAENALKDACSAKNPVQASKAEIISIYSNAM